MSKEKLVTRTIEVTRHCWSIMSGEQGTVCYDQYVNAFPFEEMVGHLGHGAQIEVTCRVIKHGRKVNNPWLKKRKRAA